jgi:hypothetical protein
MISNMNKIEIYNDNMSADLFVAVSPVLCALAGVVEVEKRPDGVLGVYFTRDVVGPNVDRSRKLIDVCVALADASLLDNFVPSTHQKIDVQIMDGRPKLY